MSKGKLYKNHSKKDRELTKIRKEIQSIGQSSCSRKELLRRLGNIEVKDKKLKETKKGKEIITKYYNYFINECNM